jgi:predicted nucleotidyltransferase
MATLDTIQLPEDLRRALDQAVQALVGAVHPQLIILFGSYAEGRAGRDSDVDLVVVTETENRWETIRTLRNLLEPVLTPRSFDLLVYAPDRWEDVRHLRGFVSQEADLYGVRLYEA